jgi:hypothetical protein
MNKKLIRLFSTFLLFWCCSSFAQNIVNVNPLTGAANAVIPIYTINSGQVSASVNLVYSGTGVKIKDVEGTAGMNWNVEAGGQISRIVRGLPDDCTTDNTGATMLGWMSANNTGAVYASSFSIQNNGGVTCNNEINDVTNINNNMPYTYDTEPDMFYVNAPGLSCQLVYDRTGTTPKFHPVNYQDIAISYVTYGGTGNGSEIFSFTITNDKGIKYVFAAPENVTQTTQSTTAPGYFATKYNQYHNGITYNDSWSLTSITDPSGNGISFTYTTAPVRNSLDPVTLYIAGSTSGSVQYNVL